MACLGRLGLVILINRTYHLAIVGRSAVVDADGFCSCAVVDFEEDAAVGSDRVALGWRLALRLGCGTGGQMGCLLGC